MPENTDHQICLTSDECSFAFNCGRCEQTGMTLRSGDFAPAGPAWEMMETIAKRGGFTIKLQLITNTSIIAANRSMDSWRGSLPLKK